MQEGNRMIKILFFISGLSEGGAEKVLCNLVNNMDQRKFDITVQTIDEYDSRKYLADGIRYKAINRYKSSFGRRLFFCWFRLCAELKLAYRFFVKDDYDIEVAYLETIPTKIIAQSTNKKAKKIAWVHCDLLKHGWTDKIVKKTSQQYQKYDKIVCVSKDVEKSFRKLYGAQFDTTVLYNVIDEEKILALAKEPLSIALDSAKWQLLAVGRLTKQKNFVYLIDTCRRLRDAGLKIHLDILGEGSERTNLEKQIQNQHLEKVVNLRGFVTNPYPWIRNTDIVVCSSKYEGISTVVQEAFVLGKPVVSTPCTGMEELLGESEFGLIADDNQDGLYHSLSDVLDSGELLALYTDKAIQRGKDFVKNKTVNKIEGFFEQFKDASD